MLPEGWRSAELCEVIAGIAGGTSVAGDDQPCGKGDKGVLTLSAVSSGLFRPGEHKRALPEHAHRLNLSVKRNTILIARKNTPELVGRVALVRNDYPHLFLPDLIWEITPARLVDPRWLWAFLDSALFRKSISAGAAGSSQSMVGITRELVLGATALIPPLSEQRRMAVVIDTWDAAIATASRLIEGKRKRFDWICDSVLTGRTRLRGFNDNWREVRLADVLDEHGLRSRGKEPVFSVSVHKGLVDQIEHLGRSFSAQSTDHYNRVLPGDIVYTKSPTGDFPLGIIKQSKVEREVIVSPLYGVFTPVTRELGVVLDAYFSSPKATERYLAPLVQKGAKNTIAVTNAQFLRGKVMIPGDDREITALADLVEASLNEIEAGEAELRLLEQQKRGLMQKLLTGRLRAPESIDTLLPGADRDLIAEAAA